MEQMHEVSWERLLKLRANRKNPQKSNAGWQKYNKFVSSLIESVAHKSLSQDIRVENRSILLKLNPYVTELTMIFWGLKQFSLSEGCSSAICLQVKRSLWKNGVSNIEETYSTPRSQAAFKNIIKNVLS